MRTPRPYGFRFRLARFFAGRNGADTLYYTALFFSLICIFLGGLFSQDPLYNLLFFALYFLFFGYSLFRFFSRNIAKRQREDRAFRRFFGKLFLPFRRLGMRFRYRKTHVFRKCPHCKSTLRLARIAGEHVVKCPACGNRFAVKVKK